MVVQLLSTVMLTLSTRLNVFDLNSAIGGVPDIELSEHSHIVVSIHSYDIPDIHISPSGISPT